ncbi:hypothetical protein HN51_058246 [Arachis hypogaea]
MRLASSPFPIQLMPPLACFLAFAWIFAGGDAVLSEVHHRFWSLVNTQFLSGIIIPPLLCRFFFLAAATDFIFSRKLCYAAITDFIIICFAGITDDALAVLASLLGCSQGLQEIRNSRALVSILIDLLRYGSATGKENSITLLRHW